MLVLRPRGRARPCSRGFPSLAGLAGRAHEGGAASWSATLSTSSIELASRARRHSQHRELGRLSHARLVELPPDQCLVALSRRAHSPAGYEFYAPSALRPDDQEQLRARFFQNIERTGGAMRIALVAIFAVCAACLGVSAQEPRWFSAWVSAHNVGPFKG